MNRRSFIKLVGVIAAVPTLSLPDVQPQKPMVTKPRRRSLTTDDINDLIRMTLKDLGRMRWTEIQA